MQPRPGSGPRSTRPTPTNQPFDANNSARSVPWHSPRKSPMKTKPKPPPKQKLSPIECKEHLDEVLEMQKEVGDLERKMDGSHKVYKEDKDRFELKRDELMQYLKGLNEEHPLFDDHNTVNLPWPFPLPEDCQEATLGNVASDPVVLGLSVSVVKAVRDKIAVNTLGQLQEYFQAGSQLSPAEQTAAKKKLGAAIGPNQAQKVLLAVASFTGGRIKGKKKAKEPEPEATVEKKTPPVKTDWRATFVADLDSITPMQAKLLGQLEMHTVGKVLVKLEEMTRNMPTGSPPDWLRKQLATYASLAVPAAGKIIDAIYAFEEEQTRKEAAAS